MDELKHLKYRANLIRQDIVKMVSEAKSGHPGGALGLADIFSLLYFEILRHKPKNPGWKDRDRLLMSNGHACAVRYSAMARAGYFPLEELKTFRKINSRLQGHPSLKDLPGVENSSGSLGQGLSMAVGICLAAKLDGKDYKTYCVISDGDLNEGSTWEAINSAQKWKLDNLIAIVDRNNIQISGKTQDVWPLEPLEDKFKSFNWNVLVVDGNDIDSLKEAFSKAQSADKPIAIIADIIPGKGVSYMEGKYEWHGKPPSKEEAQKAIEELRNEEARLTDELTES